MKKMVQKILSLLNSSEKKKLAHLIIANILVSISDIVFLAALLFVINFYTGQEPADKLAFLPPFLKNRDSLALISCFFLLFASKNTGGYFVNRSQFNFVFQVASRISANNLLKYLEGSYSDYVNIDSAIHIRKISQQPIEFSQYILAGGQQMISESVLILLSLAALLLFNAKLFVLLFIILLPALFILYAITKRRLSAIRKHVKNAGEDTLQHLQEGISGFAESNIYNRNDFFTHRYAKSQERLNSYLAELQTTQAIPSRLIEVFALFGLLLLISVTKFLALGSYGPGLVTVGAFIAAAYKIIPGMVRISNISGQIKTYDYTLDDLIALKQAKSSKKTSAFMERIRSIEFNNTGFDRGTHPVLCSFNLHIRSGDFVGVSGISGIGKTTLINLLMGFLEPGRGNILINNKETQVSDRYNYQQRIAYVKQQPFLLHDSILNNITIGEENPDRKKILEIAGISGIGNWINIISGDYSKMVSENGKNISGGQRQRIAIARALYKDADVLILDEPFNELDKASVFPVLSHLMKLSKSGKIIILITHDRQNLAFCNKIVTINGSGYCETK